MATRRSNVRHEHVPLVPQVADTSRAGEQVKIRGERGKFTVVAHVLTDTGAEWVELWAQGDHKCFRSPAPSRVIWPNKPKESK